MQTQLPRRPYVELPPPPGGLDTVRRIARHRRRRGAASMVAGGVTAAVVTMVALLVGGGVDGDAVLKPAPVPPAGGVVSPAPTASGHAGAVSGRPHRSPSSRSSAQSSTTSTQTSGSRSATPRAGTVPAVTLTRTAGSYTGYPRVCRTGSSASNSDVQPGSNWCVEPAVETVAGGERLALTVCRDSTGPGTLSFGGSREVDLVVMRGGQRVWAWSHLHPGVSSPHSLSAAADGCWTWSLVWPGVDDTGADAGHGAYSLLAVSTAGELSNDTKSVSFVW